MNIEKLMILTSNFSKGNTPQEEQLTFFKEGIAKFKVPADLIPFISQFDSAEGSVGEHYLAIWNLEDIVEVNKQYENDPVFSKYYIFGSSGGTFHYAFNKETGKIYELDLYDDEYNKYVGDSITEFIENYAELHER